MINVHARRSRALMTSSTQCAETHGGWGRALQEWQTTRSRSYDLEQWNKGGPRTPPWHALLNWNEKMGTSRWNAWADFTELQSRFQITPTLHTARSFGQDEIEDYEVNDMDEFIQREATDNLTTHFNIMYILLVAQQEALSGRWWNVFHLPHQCQTEVKFLENNLVISSSDSYETKMIAENVLYLRSI